MDLASVLEARRRHALVAPELSARRRIVLASPRARIVQGTRWTSKHGDPPRDYRELRDLGGGREWYQHFPSSRLPDRAAVYEHALVVGYKVDPRALSVAPIETHFLVWQAMCDLVREATRGPWRDGVMAEPARLHRYIRAVIPYFIVPDLEGGAHLIEQLIIVEDPHDGSERMLAVQVTRDRQTEREARYLRALDSSLTRLGFEVYRIAECWCRIDPLRAIVSVLRHAGVIDRHIELKGEHLGTIAEYVCSSCRNELVRDEPGAIELVGDAGYGECVAVHACCVESAHDGIWYPEGERRPLVA